jgi:hypothetical protein
MLFRTPRPEHSLSLRKGEANGDRVTSLVPSGCAACVSLQSSKVPPVAPKGVDACNDSRGEAID